MKLGWFKAWGLYSLEGHFAGLEKKKDLRGSVGSCRASRMASVSFSQKGSVNTAARGCCMDVDGVFIGLVGP